MTPHPTPRQLAVLDADARSGSYRVTARDLGIGVDTARWTLAIVRTHYGVQSTIEAYHAALLAGELRAEGLEWPSEAAGVPTIRTHKGVGNGPAG